MTLREFIIENRTELDAAIARMLGMAKNPRPTDAERRLWILNDEGLYNWARSQGVRIAVLLALFLSLGGCAMPPIATAPHPPVIIGGRAARPKPPIPPRHRGGI